MGIHILPVERWQDFRQKLAGEAGRASSFQRRIQELKEQRVAQRHTQEGQGESWTISSRCQKGQTEKNIATCHP